MRVAKQAGRWVGVLLAVVVVLSILSGAVTAQDPVDAPATSLEERVARDAAEALGWPTYVEEKPLRASNMAEETLLMLWPPQSAVRYFNKPMYTATNGGSYDEETIQWLRVLPMGEQGSRDFIDTMIVNGLPHSSYQGREGIVLRTGDKICNPGGLLGYIMERLQEYFDKLFSDVLGVPAGSASLDDNCAEASAGVIMWTCGSHIFIARDDTEQGGEDQIAAALWMAAERNQICDIGDTLVLLAETTDTPHTKTIADAQKLAQDANSYFGQNAYGKVSMAFTFLDADGNTGTHDAYEVGPTMAAYNGGKECQFAQDAIKKAFEAGAPREEIDLSRAVIVYSGRSKQDGGATFQTVCCWPGNNPYWTIQVGPAENRSTVYVTSMIMVSEQEALGSWVHEMGHSMYAKYLSFQNSYFVGDRYNYTYPWGQFGNISYWGLMGLGCLYGDPYGAAPTHMSSFEKESAEYLVYTDGELGKEYSLTSIERQKLGGSVLRFDDPSSINPNEYYIVEAREAGGAYGAPETGVVVYQVTWDASQAAHHHHVVNSLTPQRGTTSANGPRNAAYFRPTLRGAGDATAPTEYNIPARQIKIELVKESTEGGYSATVKAVSTAPANLVGAVAAPSGPPAVPPNAAPPNPRIGAQRDTFDGIKAATGPDLPLPDIDLHAYDEQGRHVGLNYATGQFENQIPGAIASGDLKDAEEWIYVPEGTQVRFEISAYKTEQFLQNSPEYRDVIRPQQFEMTYQRIDENGVITAAKGQGGEIKAGAQSELEGPDAPGLKYKEVKAPGYGKNLPANLWWSGLLAALGAMLVVGWIVALARR